MQLVVHEIRHWHSRVRSPPLPHQLLISRSYSGKQAIHFTSGTVSKNGTNSLTESITINLVKGGSLLSCHMECIVSFFNYAGLNNSPLQIEFFEIKGSFNRCTMVHQGKGNGEPS